MIAENPEAKKAVESRFFIPSLELLLVLNVDWVLIGSFREGNALCNRPQLPCFNATSPGYCAIRVCDALTKIADTASNAPASMSTR